jgi:hypothetical protein
VHAVAPALADSNLVVGPGCKIGRARARHGSLASVNHTEVVHPAPAEEAGAEQTGELPLCQIRRRLGGYPVRELSGRAS